jgi:hypothetical protein
MKFSAPMYDGDSIIRPGPEAPTEAPEGVIATHSTPKMVRRKIDQVDLPDTGPVVFDSFEIERRARALRAAAMRSALISFWSWVERSFEAARRRREEQYLARAQSIVELEARLRKLERSGQLVRI